jgi:hypothetical protein
MAQVVLVILPPSDLAVELLPDKGPPRRNSGDKFTVDQACNP